MSGKKTIIERAREALHTRISKKQAAVFIPVGFVVVLALTELIRIAVNAAYMGAI